LVKQLEDRWSKFVLKRIFSTVAQVESGVEMLPNVFKADILLCPNYPPSKSPVGGGLLTDLVGTRRCVIEPYSGAVKDSDLRVGLIKLQAALYRWFEDQIGQSHPSGCLLIVTTYWPRQGMKRILGKPTSILEDGIWHWQRGLDSIYIVNTAQLELRKDTILFALLGKGKIKKQALAKVFQERIEPYATLLDEFSEEYREMVRTEDIQSMKLRKIEQLQAELAELEAARSEGALAKASEKARKQMLLLQLQKKFPSVSQWEALVNKIQNFESLESLFTEILDIDDAGQMQRKLKAAAKRKSSC
jgi:hypothetical protein